MTKSRIFLTLFVVVSTVLLYMLPRYVVDTSSRDIENQATAQPSTEPSDVAHDHSFQLSDSMAAIVNGLYESLTNADNQEKRFIFADSLAEAYKTVGKLDSSAKYSELRAIENPSMANDILAGDGYYLAFNFAVDQTKRQILAEKAQVYYLRVLEEDPDALDIKSKLAMTYVTGPNPMQGITMLREVLNADPENELAIYNLGMLAITSGQLDRARERFDRLRELNPENPEAHFYLGYCLFELGKSKEAEPYFRKVLELDANSELAAASVEYLERIDN